MNRIFTRQRVRGDGVGASQEVAEGKSVHGNTAKGWPPDGTPENFTVLSTCPVRWHPDDAEWYERWEKGRVGNAVMGLYTRGGTVFTVGTTDWAHGLRGEDKVVEQITRNLLDRLGK